MANLKEVRTRIESVESTKQITSAMKMVAASKLRKAQNSIIALRPYADKMNEIMVDLSASLGESTEGKYAAVRPADKILLIAVSSNRGLCGAFNANVVRSTIACIENQYKEQFDKGNLTLVCLGKKASEQLRSRKYDVEETNEAIFDNLSYENAAVIADDLMQKFVDGKYDRIVFIYNRFKNAGTQIMTTEQFLPIEPKEQNESAALSDNDYIFEPDKKQILEELVPKTLKLQVYKILIDSFASEQGARMITMNQATDNATELLKELRVSYNKARQSAITNEIVEIVSGANALEG